MSNIYITKIVVLVSEPVRGRSRATELSCYVLYIYMIICPVIVGSCCMIYACHLLVAGISADIQYFLINAVACMVKC